MRGLDGYKRTDARFVADWMREAMDRIEHRVPGARVCFVTPYIDRMLRETAAVLPDDTALYRDDLPDADMFIALQTPRTMLESYGPESVHHFSKVYENGESKHFQTAELEQVYAKAWSVHCSGVDGVVVMEFGAGPDSLYPVHPFAAFGYNFGKPIGDRSPGYAESAIIMRWIYALARFMAQRILTTERRIADRHTRKRIARLGVDVPSIDVIRLRQKITSYKDNESTEGRDWKHRWMVRGHWTPQWYPSLGVHKKIWIEPYVKGPIGKPFLVKQATVYGLVR